MNFISVVTDLAAGKPSKDETYSVFQRVVSAHQVRDSVSGR